jgi:hypothetical protein
MKLLTLPVAQALSLSRLLPYFFSIPALLLDTFSLVSVPMPVLVLGFSSCCCCCLINPTPRSSPQTLPQYRPGTEI